MFCSLSLPHSLLFPWSGFLYSTTLVILFSPNHISTSPTFHDVDSFLPLVCNLFSQSSNWLSGCSKWFDIYLAVSRDQASIVSYYSSILTPILCVMIKINIFSSTLSQCLLFGVEYNFVTFLCSFFHWIGCLFYSFSIITVKFPSSVFIEKDLMPGFVDTL